MELTGVPGPRGIGVIPRLVRDPFGFCMAAARQGDGLVRIKAGPASAYLISEPRYVRRVLIDNAANYVKGSMMDGIRVALGNGLFTADGAAWRRQRRLMQPSFHASHVALAAGVASNVLAHAVDRWREGAERDQPLDLLAEMIGVNTEVVLRTLVGTQLSATEIAELTELIDAVFLGMANRMWTFFLPDWMPAPGRSNYRRAVAALDARIARIIASRRAATADPDGSAAADTDDLMGMLLAARDEHGEPMSDAQLRDEIFTLFLAGNESTATSLTWTAYLLARNPEVCRRLAAELDEALEGAAPTYADLGRLPYLRRVISEGFRLYPAFPMYFRTAVEADQLGDYRIPAGGYVVVSPYATHRDPRYWPDPERFDPDRFTPERYDSKARQAYYPFGVGQRRCIGEPMSLAIGQLSLTTLVSRYEFTVADERVTGRYAMTYQPKGGLRLQLRAR